MIWEILIAAFVFPFWAWFFRLAAIYVISKGVSSAVEKQKQEMEKKKKEWGAKHGRG
jgi:hypothetical protein